MHYISYRYSVERWERSVVWLGARDGGALHVRPGWFGGEGAEEACWGKCGKENSTE
jgi:hypothetical protein